MAKGDQASKAFVRKEIGAMRTRIQRAEQRANDLRNLVRDLEARLEEYSEEDE